MHEMQGTLRILFNSDASGMEFTGERYVPGIRGQIQLEHLHRYTLASTFAQGRDLLDIACGEGYGAAALAAVAKSVVGVDIDQATISHANGRYHLPNLRFLQGNVLDIPAADASFDFVVCYETLEHVAEQEQAMRELRRVLRHDGVLLISTPNREAGDEAWHENNPFHAKELSESEFQALLGANFANVNLLEQRFVHGSIIASSAQLSGPPQLIGSDDLAAFTVSNGAIGKYYLIAIASDFDLPMLPSVSVLDGKVDLQKTNSDLIYSVDTMHDLEREVVALKEEIRQSKIRSELQSIQIAFLRKKLAAQRVGS